MALRAALTGHFVLSTLHTNDAISSVGRLRTERKRRIYRDRQDAERGQAANRPGETYDFDFHITNRPVQYETGLFRKPGQFAALPNSELNISPIEGTTEGES